MAVGLVHVFGCLNLPILRQRKYAHIRLAPMARFKVYYTKRLYKDHLLPPINVITEELSNQKHQPDGYRSATRKMMQERKEIKFVKKFAENFKLHDYLPQNSDILILILINETLRYNSSTGIRKMA